MLFKLTAAVISAAFAIACTQTAVDAPDGRAMDESARISRVESGLLPQARVAGRAYTGRSLEALMRDEQVPSISLAVIDNGRIAWARAYGLADVALGRRATTETRFQAASISKAVAATAALDMVEDGLLNLDQPVNERLKSWKVPASAASRDHPVTLRHLLTHTAGLTIHGFPGYAPGAALPTVVQILNGEPPANTGAVIVQAEPGSEWKYSGGGFTVAQLLMEEAAGVPFVDLMRQRVLEPFGMRHSTFQQEASSGSTDRATAYKSDGSAVPGGAHLYPELAAAGLWTTPTDLAHWAIGLMQSWRGKGDKVLSRDTTREVLKPGLGGWGLGLAVEGEGERLEFTHGGSNEGFRSLVLAFPERGQGIAIMTNSDVGMSVGAAVLQAVAAEYGWPGYGPVLITPVSVSAEQLAELAGVYVEGSGQVEIRPSAQGDSLDVLVSNGMRLELVPVGDDTYADAEGGDRSRFERDANGTVVAFNPGFARFTKVSPAP